MATIVLTLSAGDQTRIVNAEAWKYNYLPTIFNAQGVEVANPETKAQFSMRMVRKMLAQDVKDYEKQLNEANANSTFESSFSEPTIT